MKTFTVCYGADVSCYGSFEIEARDEAHALEVAREKFAEHTHELEPEWANGFEQERIVNIEDEDGNTFHEGEDVYPTSADLVTDNAYLLLTVLKSVKRMLSEAPGSCESHVNIVTLIDEALEVVESKQPA